MRTPPPETPRTYAVLAHQRAPLVQYIADALRAAGCRLLHEPSPDRAPFRFTFELPSGERQGIVAYAFFANSKATRNRPADEHRFQVKYGPDDGELHPLWQDPYGLYTTLLLGIDPERGVFVAADPVLHSPTPFFMSIEFKADHVDAILRNGWHAWERARRSRGVDEGPVEVLVGGTNDAFLRYVRFEREALGESPGHRQLLADRFARPAATASAAVMETPVPTAARLHQLAEEFQLTDAEVLDLIAGARRLKMAVRGWVAEEHLVRELRFTAGVTECTRLDDEGGPDVRLRYEGGPPVTVECKNVLRQRAADGLARLDFQRTRAAKSDPCSRYYQTSDFDVVAACLHAVSERWEFRFARSAWLDPHRSCTGKLSHLVRIDHRWDRPVHEVLRAAGAR